jgi:hypothetical protein
MAKLFDQHRAFVEALYERAASGALKWEIGDSSTVKTCIANTTVEIGEDLDYSEQPTIRVRILNDSGETVDSFDANYFSNATPAHVDFRTYWSLLSELYNVGNRAARGADKILADLLSSLGAKEIPAPKANPAFDTDLDDDVPF